MNPFEAVIDQEGVIVPSGEFDLAVVGEFAQATAAALDEQAEVVVDLERRTFLDLSAIRALIRLARQAEGKPLVLRHPKRNVRRILDLVDLDGRAGITIQIDD